MATRNGADGPSNLKSSENLIAVCAAAGPAQRAAATTAASIIPACCRRMLFNKSMSLPLKCRRFVLADAVWQAVQPRRLVDCCTAKNMPNERARSDHATGSWWAFCTPDCQAATVAGHQLGERLIN